jgi:hypothetical protein
MRTACSGGFLFAIVTVCRPNLIRKRESEREAGSRAEIGKVGDILLWGKKEHYFVRRFPGFALSSF